MSTFNGLVPEFPDIRSASTPYSRRRNPSFPIGSLTNPRWQSTFSAITLVFSLRWHAFSVISIVITWPGLIACDHPCGSHSETGSESRRCALAYRCSVYCSAATREILLRLERYPCRINYAKGILEARQLTYKHLGKVLVQFTPI